MLARTLGADDAGLIYLGLTVVAATVVILRFGLGVLLVREVASSNANRQSAIATGYWILITGIVFSVTLLFSVLGYVLSDVIAESLFSLPVFTDPLSWFFLGAPFLSLLYISGMVYQANGDIRAFVFLNSLAFQVVLLVFVSIVTSITAIEVARLWFVLVSILGLIAFVFSARLFETDKVELPAIRSIIQPALAVWWVQILTTLQLYGVPIIVAAVLPPKEFVIFFAATRIAMLVSLVLTVVDSVVIPQFAALKSEANHRKSSEILKQALIICSVVAIPTVMSTFYAAEFLLSLFGSEFVNGAVCLQVLLLGRLFQVMTGPSGSLLTMSGYEQRVSQSATIGLFTMAISGLYLVPNFGIIGVATCVSLSMFIGNLLNIFWLWKDMSINIFRI